MKRIIWRFILIICLAECWTIVVNAGDDKLNLEWKQASSELVGSFTWSPDSQHIAFTDIETHNLYIMNVHTETVERQYALPPHSDDDYSNSDLPNALSWSPNGLYIATTVNGIAYILDAQSGDMVQEYSVKNEVKPHDQTVVDIRWGQDSLSLAALSYLGQIHIFDAQTGKTIKIIHTLSPDTSGGSYKFDWSIDNSLFAAPSTTTEQETFSSGKYQLDISTTIGIWDKDGNRIDKNSKKKEDSCQVAGTMRGVSGLKWSTDSKKLAIATGDGLTICTVTNDLEIHSQSISDVILYTPSWSLDGHWLITSRGTDPNDCQINIFDASGNYRLVQTIEDKICKVAILAWSPNGEQIAVINNRQLWIGTLISK